MDWSDLDENGSATFNENTSTPQDNLSLTCLARSIEQPERLPYSAAFIKTVASFLAMQYYVVFIIATSMNVLLMVLVAKYKKLQTHSFGIALEIAAINVVVSFLYLAGAISNSANQWVLGEYTCMVAGMLLFVYIDVRTLLMFVFVVNRFLFVFMPFSYSKYHRKVILVLSLVTWLLPVAASIGLLPQISDCIAVNPTIRLCSQSSRCGRSCSVFSSINYSLVAIPATVIPTVLYTILYLKAKKVMKATATTTVQDNSDRSQNDWKATITFFILFLSLFAATLPTATITVTLSRLYQDRERPPAIHILSAASFSVQSYLTIIDPIVIMRHRDAREALQDLKDKIIQKLCNKRIQRQEPQARPNNVGESAL